jgi:rubredoxin
MICPRCNSPKTTQMVSSPEGDEWELYQCEACHYSWRSTEPSEQTDPARYHPWFKLTKERIDQMTIYPPLP